jgi:Ser/Thr protein kinase RdoA (MazF antagonist)
VRDVLARYGLDVRGDPHDLRLGRRSLNAVVSTPRGLKVLKLYRPQWKPATVAYGHSILTELEDRRFPAVRLERTLDATTSVTIDGRVFAVFDFVRGTNYSLNFLLRADRMRLTVIAARTLAAFHRCLDGFVPRGEHHLGFASLTGARRRDTEWHATKLEELRRRSRGLTDPEAAHYAGRLDAVADELLLEIAGLERTLAEASFHRLVIHGDYGMHNLIYRRDGAVPVDFEVSRLDVRINEVISAMGKYRYRGGSYDLESMHTFMAAYAQSFPLTPDEEALLLPAWRLYKLQAAVQYWNSYFETDGPTRKLVSALDAIDQANRVLEHPDMVRELVTTASGRRDPGRRHFAVSRRRRTMGPS